MKGTEEKVRGDPKQVMNTCVLRKGQWGSVWCIGQETRRSWLKKKKKQKDEVDWDVVSGNVDSKMGVYLQEVCGRCPQNQTCGQWSKLDLHQSQWSFECSGQLCQLGDDQALAMGCSQKGGNYHGERVITRGKTDLWAITLSALGRRALPSWRAGPSITPTHGSTTTLTYTCEVTVMVCAAG